MINLKPCPFCGGIAELKAPGYEHYSPCWCKCTRCGAEGPTKSSELEAEKGWNERVQDNVEHTQTIGGWISVKDRLPERKEYLHESNVIRGSSEYVLVYISATFPYKRMFVTIGRYSYDEMYPRWVVRSSHDGDVTHWMPLPEPPKEDER